jgi:hypothetical protein
VRDQQAEPGRGAQVRRGDPREVPGQDAGLQLLALFNWKKNLDDATIAKFQKELGAMGYKFQFITLAGFHSLNYGMFDLAHGYARRQMSAFVELQEKEFAAAERGFTAVKHQREVGTGYFDAVTQAIQQGQSSTTALDSGAKRAERPTARFRSEPVAYQRNHRPARLRFQLTRLVEATRKAPAFRPHRTSARCVNRTAR